MTAPIASDLRPTGVTGRNLTPLIDGDQLIGLLEPAGVAVARANAVYHPSQEGGEHDRRLPSSNPSTAKTPGSISAGAPIRGDATSSTRKV